MHHVFIFPPSPCLGPLSRFPSMSCKTNQLRQPLTETTRLLMFTLTPSFIFFSSSHLLLLITSSPSVLACHCSVSSIVPTPIRPRLTTHSAFVRAETPLKHRSQPATSSTSPPVSRFSLAPCLPLLSFVTRLTYALRSHLRSLRSRKLVVSERRWIDRKLRKEKRNN